LTPFPFEISTANSAGEYCFSVSIFRSATAVISFNLEISVLNFSSSVVRKLSAFILNRNFSLPFSSTSSLFGVLRHRPYIRLLSYFSPNSVKASLYFLLF
jgi:hypothetical protein